ncbi:hypothetical protein [Rhodococcus aetherivorans]|uniref:hypothetical protein n=1 Tax=Rhodococcus aetherivorans TaxID=191292 RepID=UPI00294A952C|nr:hypothetical protein [Rhodococcus aetherivorans]MDV6295168.1 hypothetical protein [Rhodococcus aetherivorans]
MKHYSRAAWASLILAIGVTVLLSTIAQYIGVIFQLVALFAVLVGVAYMALSIWRWINDRRNRDADL